LEKEILNQNKENRIENKAHQISELEKKQYSEI
jgi:hypothetical protein